MEEAGDLFVTVRVQVDIEFSAGNKAAEGPEGISSNDIHTYTGLTGDLDAFVADVTHRNAQYLQELLRELQERATGR